MRGKLAARENGPEAVTGVIAALQREGLQSDRRYTESYLHGRLEKGYGPVRISQELREKGIDADLIEELLMAQAVDWVERAATVRAKKFGAAKPGNFREQAQQSRFLQYRGFTSEQIRDVFKLLESVSKSGERR